eukprot:CAMPEP_0117446574 /NCGR_PEP_ID=MMETSP0759-20121206/6416_1 /TAXON_ID=63605 /ORGANISM="Percolomonas cosmopolitus, Strain WS" /LENGTH=457 /DNA_ID=CAMNT_0005238855 /DNA_START=174 /DNA_END=1545 /DNA_ORIENTATION=+
MSLFSALSFPSILRLIIKASSPHPRTEILIAQEKTPSPPKRQRYIISKNLDDELLDDHEFLEEFARLKSDGSMLSRDELNEKLERQNKKRKLSTREKKRLEFERITREMHTGLNHKEQAPNRTIDEEYSRKDAKPLYVSVADGKRLESQYKLDKKMSTDTANEESYTEEDRLEYADDTDAIAAEALEGVKDRMKKWRNKRMRKEFRDKNALLIKNKLISTKELLREHMKELQQRKRVHLKREEKQQAHRLGLASGSMDQVRSYIREKEVESRHSTKTNPYTKRDESGVAAYQYAYANKIQEALQGVLEKENRNKYLEQVLIYHVRVDPSKRYADVLWDYKFDENRNTLQRTHTNDLLQQAAGFLASKVGDRLRSKYAPIFTFYYYEDFSRNTPFHAIYDTFDGLGFKTTMEERMQEYHSTPIYNPMYTSPQVKTKSQKRETEYNKKQRLKEFGKSKW